MHRTFRESICWLLVVVMTLGPTVVWAETPLEQAYVTPGTVAAAVAHPRRVLTAPEMEMLPYEVISAAGIEHLKIDPLDVEQLLVIVEPPTMGPPAAGVVIRFSKPYPMGSVLPDLLKRTEKAKLDGRVYRRGVGPMAPSLYAVDNRTLIVAHQPLLEKMLGQSADPKSGLMSELLAEHETLPDLLVGVVVEPVRPMLQQQLKHAPIPAPFESARRIPGLISSIQARANLLGTQEVALTVTALDEGSAEELDEIIAELFEVGQEMMLAEMERELANETDPVAQAMGQYLRRISEQQSTSLRPTLDGDRLELAATGSAYMSTATIGVLVALLLPAIQAAREAARRMQSTNNLKQLGLAMHNYHQTYRNFPARASFDEAGNPLLSWRVHILPFLEQDNLYRQFHLDEPWDSEHNSKLIAAMPQLFRNPSSTNVEPGMTTYLAITGEGTAFEGTEGHRISRFLDGLSSSLLLVEANDEAAVPWTAPEDWEYDSDDPLAGLGSAHPEGFLAAFADGSVKFLSEMIEPEIFGQLVTISDGGVVRVP